MKTIYRTYHFELKPTPEQKTLLDKHFGCVRYIYNHFLNERKEQYQADKKSDNYYKQAARLTELKKKEVTIWLKEVNSQSAICFKMFGYSLCKFLSGQSQVSRV